MEATDAFTFSKKGDDLNILQRAHVQFRWLYYKLVVVFLPILHGIPRVLFSCCFREPLSVWWKRVATFYQWRFWLDDRLEDLHDWVSSKAPAGSRQSVPVHHICTTINSWRRAFPDEVTFEHAILQEGRCWRLGDNRAPDLELGKIELGSDSEKVGLLPEVVGYAQADPTLGAVFHAMHSARNPPGLPLPQVLPPPGSPRSGLNSVPQTPKGGIPLVGPSSEEHVVKPHPWNWEPAEKPLPWNGERLKLSDAMAISAAALAFGMGRFQTAVDRLRVGALQGVFGLAMGKTVWAVDRLSWEMVRMALLPFGLQVFSIIMLLILAFDVIWKGGTQVSYADKIHQRFNLVVIYLSVTAAQLLVLCWWPSDFVACFPMLRAARRFFGMVHHSSTVESRAPRHLILSDGGHSENLALLPLLRARQKFIISMDGGADPEQTCDDLLLLMDDASRRWGIHFTPWVPKRTVPVSPILQASPRFPFPRPLHTSVPIQYPPVDLHAYIKYDWSQRDLVENSEDRSAMVLAIEVHYPGVGSLEAETGLLLYLKPRPYRQATDPEHYTYSSLHGCCCNSCHGTSFCCSVSTLCCHRFPHHNTANQFFTPSMHR
jgi:hypothetical protein